MEQKFKISEPRRAFKFLQAVKSRNYEFDGVSIRLSDIDDVESLLAADIYYHNTCMLSYLVQHYDNETICILCSHKCRKECKIDNTKVMQDFLNKSRTNQDTILTDELLETFNESQLQFLLPCYIHKTCLRNYLENSTINIFEKHLKPMVQDLIKKKYAIALSELRDHITTEYPGVQIYNHKIKQYLISVFGDELSFCKPFNPKDSEVLFPSSIDKKK